MAGRFLGCVEEDFLPFLEFIPRGEPPDGDAVRSFALSLRQVEDLRFESRIGLSQERVRFWCKENRSAVLAEWP